MKYRREIDGLRALAILPVIFFHAGFNWFSGGYVGVDIFFVISGYLITTIILEEKLEGKFNLINFYERRARRILPALFFVMAICIPFAWLLLFPNGMREFSKSLIAVPVYASNILFWREAGYFDTAAELKPLLHTWSLAVEEQYYLFFPLLILVTWRLRKAWVIGLLFIIFFTSLIFSNWYVHKNPEIAFYSLVTRIWEFLIGSFIAFYFQKNKISTNSSFNQSASILGLFLVIYSVLFFDNRTPFPSFYALMPTVGTALIIIYANSETFIGRILGNKIFVGIGIISYSAYLWHQPLFAFARHQSLNELSKTILIILSILSILLAYFSWRFIEKPFRQKEFINRKNFFIFSALASSFFISFGFVGYFEALPIKYDDKFKNLINVQKRSEPSSYCAILNDSNIPNEGCILNNGESPGIALIGDSHADALGYSFSKKLQSSDKFGVLLQSTGCPPILPSTNSNNQIGYCETISKRNFEYVIENKKIQYVVLSARWALNAEIDRFNNEEGGVENGNPKFLDIGGKQFDYVKDKASYKKMILDKYIYTVKNYLKNGKKVVLIYDVPEAGWHVPDYLMKQLKLKGYLTINDGSISYDVYKRRTSRVQFAFDQLGDYPTLFRVRPENIFCNKDLNNRCVTHSDDKSFYRDDDHLSNFGAEYIADQVFGIINQQSLVNRTNNSK